MNDFVIITVNITTVTKEYQVQKGQKLHNKSAFKKKGGPYDSFTNVGLRLMKSYDRFDRPKSIILSSSKAHLYPTYELETEWVNNDGIFMFG